MTYFCILKLHVIDHVTLNHGLNAKKSMVICILIVITCIMYCLLLYVLRFNASVADP